MSSRQLEYWRVFFRLEPWGHEQDWLRAGTVAAVVRNANPFRAEGAEPVFPHQFIPKPVKAVNRKAPEKPTLEAAARRGGAEVIDYTRGGDERGRFDRSR